ncbi:DNA/RNA nuclease SfsA [Porticoccus sp. GXU_MW_L64]
MKFNPPLECGTLIKRYKRFLADVQTSKGDQITIHCPNTGSMKNCLSEGSPCWFSRSDNPKRKYPCTWEIATTPCGHRAGVNTGRPNHLVREAIEQGVVAELQGYSQLCSEVKYGAENSRIDLLLSDHPERPDQACYVEVKNVTLHMGDGLGLFPDSVSTRGSKHLRELAAMVEQGQRAVLFYCVQHTGIERVMPADDIDPEYGKTLRQAVAAGVEVLAYRAELSADEIRLIEAIPFSCP